MKPILETLLLSRDSQLISTMQAVSADVGMDLKLCSGFAQCAALLLTRKIYAILIDHPDAAAANTLLMAARRSSSSKNAVSIAFAKGSAVAAFEAALQIAKPVSADLALRTLRAAQGPMFQEFRRYVRHPLQVPVTMTTASNQELQAKAINISQSGLAVQLADPEGISTTTAVCVRFGLPVSSAWVHVEGQIVWVNSTGSAGLQCRGVTQNDRERLQEWFAAQLVRGLP
jgi:hypothetical protein